MLTPGTELTLEPEKPVAGGSMLARHDGRVVLVRGAIPGEAVRARIERVAKGVAYATVIEVAAADADRRRPAVDPACGGNALAHVAYARQLTLKADIIADAFARLAGVQLGGPVHVEPSPEHGYRVRARLHVVGHRVGFYREGTHELCDPGTSGQLRPQALDIARQVAGRFADAGIGVAEIDLAENLAGTACALHLDLGEEPTRGFEPGPGPDGLTGLSWSSPAQPDTHVLSGTPYVVDVFDAGGVSLRLQRHVRAFFQANRYLVSVLVDRVLSLVPPGPVVDLYAGVGLFAVAAAARGTGDVTAVEGDRISASDLAVNAATGVAPFATHHLPVEDYLAGGRPIGDATVILDPPRTGLSRAAARGLLDNRPARIVYVSCDVATLARDVRTFAVAYALRHLEAFDLFPNTAHVEMAAVLETREGRST